MGVQKPYCLGSILRRPQRSSLKLVNVSSGVVVGCWQTAKFHGVDKSPLEETPQKVSQQAPKVPSEGSRVSRVSETG